MSEATHVRNNDRFSLNAAGAYSSWQLIQAPSGEAVYLDSSGGLSSGDYSDRWRKWDQASLDKASGVVMLAGQEAFWDHANNRVTYFRSNNSRDFAVGTLTEDATAAAVKAIIDLNRRPHFDIDIERDRLLHVPIGTQGLNTMGVFRRGGGHKFILSTTSEAQKLDALMVDGVKTTQKWILEGMFTIVAGGAAAEPDFNIGMANGTHNTDFDAITEYAALHIDGNSTVISAQSKDPVTPVAATNTTVAYTAGSGATARVHFILDGRDLTSLKWYINGARVLSGTTFRLDSATGPLFPIVHLEKTSSATIFEADIDRLRLWTSEQ